MNVTAGEVIAERIAPTRLAAGPRITVTCTPSTRPG
jgi:hypothetical protein